MPTGAAVIWFECIDDKFLRCRKATQSCCPETLAEPNVLAQPGLNGAKTEEENAHVILEGDQSSKILQSPPRTADISHVRKHTTGGVHKKSDSRMVNGGFEPLQVSRSTPGLHFLMCFPCPRQVEMNVPYLPLSATVTDPHMVDRLHHHSLCSLTQSAVRGSPALC